jgi:hypothetical protein
MRLVRVLSYANVVSTLACVVALSGTAYAAGVPALITGQVIQDGTVTSRIFTTAHITDRDLALDSVHLRNLTDRAQGLFESV